MKTNREILIIVRDYKIFFYSSLCRLLLELQNRDLISKDELNKIRRYLYKNKPKKLWNHNYFWKPGLWIPRLRWLNKHIKKLTK